MLGEEVLVDNHYQYDGNGNRIGKKQLQGAIRYAYDALNRLKRVEYPDYTEELFYDRAGNRRKRVAGEETEVCQYDRRNRLTERRGKGGREYYTYDEAGNLLRDGRAAYTYDAFHRTSKVETFSGEIQINRYDAEGLRHEMEENGKLVQFIYRDREIVFEEKAEEKVRYIRTDKLLASDAQQARTWYHYASDELGSITQVEREGEIVNRYEYDAWGNLIACEEQGENRFKFNGQQLDPISQQYYLRARYYNPVIGRFTQEDTYYQDGLNLYVYCRNNPVCYVDPSGNICEAAAQRIMNKLDGNQAGRNEQKKLAAYLRDKVRHGETLNAQERNAAQKLGVDIKSGRYSEDIIQYEKLKSQYAADEIYNAERIGSALKDDPSHRAASYLSKEQLANGRTYSFTGGDNKSYTLLQTKGQLDGVDGIFEYITNDAGQVTHQRFIKGGIYTGFPNQVVSKGGY